jgi:hypothetical protein
MLLPRTILKYDIVKKLYPNSTSIRSAMAMLRQEIQSSPEIKKKVAEAGSTRKHYYNIKQLEIILNHLNISLEEYENL